MGKLPGGINGPLKGKAGSVHGSSRNGEPYIKGPHKKRTKKISKTEKANRNTFSDAQHWLSPVLDFVREGFKGYTTKAPGFRGAISHLLVNSFEGVKPDLFINPSLVKVSFGSLPLSANVAVELVNGNSLKFTWDNGVITGASGNDQVMMLAYDINNKVVHHRITGDFRKNGSDTLGIATEKGSVYNVYLAFNAEDRSRQSDSIYLGEITI